MQIRTSSFSIGLDVYETSCMASWEVLEDWVYIEWGTGEKELIREYRSSMDYAVQVLIEEQEYESVSH